jgi:hypothetical protein
MWSRYGHYLFVWHLVRHRHESWLHIYVLTFHLIIAAKSLSPPPSSQVPTPPRKPQPPYHFFRDKLSTIHTIAAYLLYSNEIDKVVLFLGRCTSNSNYIQTGSWGSKLWVGKLTLIVKSVPLEQVLEYAIVQFVNHLVERLWSNDYF